VRGNGDKEGVVPASAEMMVELGRYRRERGLSTRHEDTPLVLPLGGSMKPLTRAALQTSSRTFLPALPGDLGCAATLSRGRRICSEQASAHWLRHTAGSHMADGGADLRTVRDNLRHASLASTDPYLHTPDHQCHRETGEKHRIDW
jgi:site-specific recombinase XerD